MVLDRVLAHDQSLGQIAIRRYSLHQQIQQRALALGQGVRPFGGVVPLQQRR